MYVIPLDNVLAVLLDVHWLLMRTVLILWQHPVCAVPVNPGFIDYHLYYQIEQQRN